MAENRDKRPQLFIDRSLRFNLKKTVLRKDKRKIQTIFR